MSLGGIVDVVVVVVVVVEVVVGGDVTVGPGRVGNEVLVVEVEVVVLVVEEDVLVVEEDVDVVEVVVDAVVGVGSDISVVSELLQAPKMSAKDRTINVDFEKKGMLLTTPIFYRKTTKKWWAVRGVPPKPRNSNFKT